MEDDEFVGLDTNVLIDFIENPMTREYVGNHPLVIGRKLCTTTINISEAEKYIGADKINAIVNSLQIQILKPTVEDLQFSLRLEKEYKEFGAHQPDTAILACFLNNHVRIVMSVDFSFCKIAGKLGFRVIKVPSKDKVLDIMLKRALKRV